jgi:GMP synthase (glutamine-hydrolysing)
MQGRRSVRDDSLVGRPVLVLQHIACEPPAAYAAELAAREIATETLALTELGARALPDWRAYSAIIAMGGPMGTYDDGLLPWLAAEKSLIGDAVSAGVPFWGVCLGAQLLAAALGARVFRGERPEIGVLPVTLAPAARADPVFAAAPTELDALHWHSDTYELPRGATHLASSVLYAQQAFAFRRAYALQFHLEVSAELVREWAAVPAYRESLEQAHGPGALDSLIADVEAAEDRLAPLARALFGRWLEEVAFAREAQNTTGLPLGTTSTEPREASSTDRA